MLIILVPSIHTPDGYWMLYVSMDYVLLLRQELRTPLTPPCIPLLVYTTTVVLGLRTTILSQGLSILYGTHVLLESMNMGVVLMVSTMGIHSMTVCARALYGNNLYLELV